MNPYQDITRFRARRPRPMPGVDEFLNPDPEEERRKYLDSPEYLEKRNREAREKSTAFNRRLRTPQESPPTELQNKWNASYQRNLEERLTPGYGMTPTYLSVRRKKRNPQRILRYRL